VQSVEINDCSCTKGREKMNYSLYRGHKLFLNEDWFEVVKVNYGIASTSIFRIDDRCLILSSSKSTWFGTEMTRAEFYDKVEIAEVFRPTYLSLINILVVEKYSIF